MAATKRPQNTPQTPHENRNQMQRPADGQQSENSHRRREAPQDNGQAKGQERDRMEELRLSPTMARLLDAMESGKDVGHYGQFTFATVARHFIDDEAIIDLLARQPDMDEGKARALLLHVVERGYNPPRRERILQHQNAETFAIIPDPEDPDCGNLYRELQFPEAVYADINEYYEEKAEAQTA